VHVGFAPVKPFLSGSTVAFVGNKVDSRASLHPSIANEVQFGKLGTELADFDVAISACVNDIAIVYVDHGPPPNNTNSTGSDDLCPDVTSKVGGLLQSAAELWQSDLRKLYCAHTHSIAVEKLAQLDSKCLVLYNFHGFWKCVGKLGRSSGILRCGTTIAGNTQKR